MNKITPFLWLNLPQRAPEHVVARTIAERRLRGFLPHQRVHCAWLLDSDPAIR
jgi:hypothetical protein